MQESWDKEAADIHKMVLKKEKHGISSGSHVCSHCYHMNVGCQYGYVLKFLLNIDNDKGKQAEKDLVAQLDQHLFDGDIPLLKRDRYFLRYMFSCEINYSLNKRKRWTIPQQITDLIDGGELEDENYKLVMHKRVSKSRRNDYYYSRRNVSMDRDTLSYHDSKYAVHHSFPKKALSSMSDLKLNCHRKQEDFDTSSAGSKSTSALRTRKHKKKPHFRGVQRKLMSQPKEKPSRINIGEVLNGTFHHVSEPEVRYEVNYPPTDTSIRSYCGGHDHRLKDWMKYGKSKGNCSKADFQWYHKNITSSEQSWYQGYHDDEYLSVFEEEEELDNPDEEASLYLHNGSAQITLADFCPESGTKPGHSFFLCDQGKRSQKKALTDTLGSNFGKNRVISVEHSPNGQGEEQIKENEVSESGDVAMVTNAIPSWSDVDFEADFCRCVIVRDSVDSYRLSHPGDFQVANCAPPMMTVAFKGETTQGSLVLWQKSDWSTVSTRDQEYWVKVQRQSDQVNMNVHSLSLRDKLQADRVFTIQEVITIAGTLLDQSTPRQRFTPEKKKDCLSTGQLTAALCGSVIELKTVEEAYQTLVNTEEFQTDTSTQDMNALLSTYEILSPSSELGFCETCLCLSENPYKEGCVLRPCGHYFCIHCWRRYIWEKIREGTCKITCQTYKCDSIIDEVMVRCLLPSDVAIRWICRNMETMVESSQKWNWCPKASCHKVATVSNQGKKFASVSLPVLCGCDRAWCFSCLSDIHWPATCDQFSVYKKMLLQNGDEGRWNQVEKMVYFVEVKRCPKCRYPMEKNGGCSHMTCKCSYSFCWECLMEWSLHIRTGMLSCAKHRKEAVTMELDNSIRYAFPIQMYKKSVEHRFKWKRTMHLKSIQARAKFYAVKAKKRNSTKFELGEMMDEKLYSEVESSLIFIREVHIILENIYTMLSNATHKSGIMSLVQSLLDRLVFSVERLEQIFASSRLSENQLRKSKQLRTSIGRTLETFALYVPHIQRQISESKQSILGKSIDNFVSYH